jgi:hypothetical protein
MNTILRHGLVAGVLVSILLFAPYFIFGPRPDVMRWGEVIGYASMALCLSATWFAMRAEQRRRGGTLRWTGAFGIGVGVSAVAGVVFGLGTWAFYATVGDSLPEAMLEYYRTLARDAGGGPDAIAARLAELDAMRDFFFNRPLQAAVMFATVFVIGVVESVVGAWFVTRRRRA